MTLLRQETRVLVLTADHVACATGADQGANWRYKNPRLTIETRELGTLAPDHVRVVMLYAGVCGTDLHMLQTDPNTGLVSSSAPAYFPPEGRVIGHEGVGRILATGAAVRSPSPGDVVAFASIIACLHCDICRRGEFNQCPSSFLLGMQVDGLFGTIVDVPASIAHNVSHIATDDAGLRAAACVEPAGVALLACEKGRVAPGDSVTIFGGGPVGVLCAMICKRVLGAPHVALVEPLEFRREAAARWCDATYDVEGYFNEEREPIDVVIDASGDLGNIPRVFRSIGANGRVVLLGRRGMPLYIDAVDHMITQAISISGSRGHLGGQISRVVALYRSGLLPLDGVITGEVDSLDALQESLRNADKLPETQCKLVARL